MDEMENEEGKAGRTRGQTRAMTTLEREEYMAKLAELDRHGKNGREISELLGVTPQQVSYDKKKLMRKYSQAQVDFAARREEKREQYRELRAELYDVWNMSRGRLEERLQRELTAILADAIAIAKEDGVPLPDKITLQIADKPLMDAIQKILDILDAERALDGLDEPKRTVNDNRNLNVGMNFNWDSVVIEPGDARRRVNTRMSQVLEEESNQRNEVATIAAANLDQSKPHQNGVGNGDVPSVNGNGSV